MSGYLQTLKLNTKLVILYTIVGIGMVLVGIVGYANISAMKKNLDDLYFGSFVPVNELNDLITIYNGGVETTVYRLTSGTITPFEASALLSENLDKIHMLWSSYESHYKRGDEQKYVNFTAETLSRANRHVKRVIDVCHQGINVQRLSAAATTNVVTDVTDVIRKLLQYEKEVAYLERRKLLVTYDNTVIQLVIILGIVTSAVLWLSYTIFGSIRLQQRQLENTTANLKAANTKLEDASYTDSLTGLHNRRYFNMIFDRELKRAKRSGTAITFMMADIDHFKFYNDTYGHLEGDKALSSVAAELKKSLQRPGDFVFRLGGEEFGILITESTPQSAKKTVQMLCESIEALKIPHEHNDWGCVTLSIGALSTVPPLSLDANDIFAAADANLYKAKEDGRNGFVFTSETPRPSVQNPHRSRAGAA